MPHVNPGMARCQCARRPQGLTHGFICSLKSEKSDNPLIHFVAANCKIIKVQSNSAHLWGLPAV